MAFYFTLGLTIGMVAGIIIKYIQDTRIINGIQDHCAEITRDNLRKLSEEDLKIINKLIDQNEELTSQLYEAKKEINRQKDFFEVPEIKEKRK